MKPRRPRIHISDSEEPIREGDTIRAACGADVPNAAFVFMWDDHLIWGRDDGPSNLREAIENIRGLCSKCRKAELQHRYISGIVTRGDTDQA